MTRPLSEHVASFPSHEFRGHGSTFSTASSSARTDPLSNHGYKPSRTLPTHPPITRAVSTFHISRFWLCFLGFIPSPISWNWGWGPSRQTAVEPPSLNCVDYPPPSGASIFPTPTPRSQKFLTSSVPFPFSRICRCVFFAPEKTPMSGPFLRPRQYSPGPFL